MNKSQLLKLQERIFDIFVYTSYVLIFVSFFGLSQTAPIYLNSLDYYIRIYTCLFLMWRFNPFRTHYDFTELDRKIAFSAGAFIFTTTILKQYLTNIKEKAEEIKEKTSNVLKHDNNM